MWRINGGSGLNDNALPAHRRNITNRMRSIEHSGTRIIDVWIAQTQSNYTDGVSSFGFIDNPFGDRCISFIFYWPIQGGWIHFPPWAD